MTQAQFAIVQSQTFATADGKTFATRKEAEAHQVVAARTVKVQAVLDAQDPSLGELSVAALIATLADSLVAALANPLNRGRKVKAAAADAQAV